MVVIISSKIWRRYTIYFDDVIWKAKDYLNVSKENLLKNKLSLLAIIYIKQKNNSSRARTLFRNIEVYVWWNVPAKCIKILPYFWNAKTPSSFFFISSYFIFSLMNAWKHGFSYSKIIANFDVFSWNISLSIILLFPKSGAAVILIYSVLKP